jgi:predicted N-acyltransferase
MRKNFPLHIDGRHPDRVLDAVKHEVRKYLKRERRRDLPEGVDFWDFDCKCGLQATEAEVVHVAALMTAIDALAKAQAKSVYVEILAKHGKRSPKPVVAQSDHLEDDLPE